MKYLHIFLSVFLLIFLFSSCSSSPQSGRERVSVDLNSLKYEIGSVEVQLDKLLGGLKKDTLTVTYYPADDVVCLYYRVDFTNHYLFLNESGRIAFITALERYKDDYEQRELVNRKSRTRRAYGKAPSMLHWETFSFTGAGQSYPEIEFGYFFKNGFPFFTITQPETENTHETTKDRVKTNTREIFHFTRAQGDELAALFDQQLLRPLGNGFINNTDPDLDVY